VTILHDEPDNLILECAAAAEADVVVSGDRHLLKLRRLEGTSIIRLADFLWMFPESGEA
jgi:predicted nucleic acid-binding protein